MALRVISDRLVRQLLPMDECIELMSTAMVAASRRELRVPPRLFAPLVDGSGDFGLMPVSALEPPAYGAKVISLHRDNPAAGRPAIQGFVALFDHATGEPIALLEAGEITALRTAAASGLATRHLARPDARTHGIFGTGVQVGVHIDAIAVARDIDEVVVWGRDPRKAIELAERETDRTSLCVRASSDPRDAAACDIVSTVTGSPEPVLRHGDVAAGCHVNLVGAHTPRTREADSELMTAARVYTDSLESLMNEAGDFLIPLDEGRFDRSHAVGEIGQVIEGRIPGRGSAEEITVYKSLGIAAQDLVAAFAVYEKAKEAGLGAVTPLRFEEIEPGPAPEK